MQSSFPFFECTGHGAAFPCKTMMCPRYPAWSSGSALPEDGKRYIILSLAKVAELVDALDLESSALCVGVQFPPFAPNAFEGESREIYDGRSYSLQ